MTDINTVYVGNKPPMSYVMALITAFSAVGTGNVVLKARGRAISRAVDVAEIARNRYLKDVEVAKIEIGTEQLPAPGGGTRGVSTIAIILKKKGVEKAPEPKTETPEKEVKSVEEDVAPLSQLDLSEIKGVGSATEEKLKEAGYETVKSVSEADVGNFSEKTGISEKVATKLIESAKEIVK